MIYTLTLNPSIDYIMDIENIELGEVNRSSNEMKFPGGKGINVSRVLSEIDCENTALGYVGGFTGEYIKNTLNNYKIDTDFITLEGDSRINVKVKGKIETELNANGPKIPSKKIYELFNKLEKLQDGDFLILAGRIQSGVSSNLYVEIQEKLKDKDIKIVIDTSGEALLETVKRKPFLIKPNDKELGEIFNVEINSLDEVINYGKKLQKLGAKNVIVSMGAKGAVLISKDKIYIGKSPKGKVKNSVGAGDSLVGGFIGTFTKTNDLEKSFKVGLASGSATAFSNDIGNKETIFNLLEQVKIYEHREI